MGWGRDMFKLDHDQVELKQHDAALETIAGTALMQYLYDEFDDGKQEIILPKADFYLEVKVRVEPESRRWFPQSSSSFGKEIVRLKQALAAKGFEVSDGWMGTKKNKKRTAKIVRIDEEATGGNRREQEQNESPVASFHLQNPEKEVGGNRRTGDSASFPVTKIKKYRRRGKRTNSPVPPVPPAEKATVCREKEATGDPELSCSPPVAPVASRPTNSDFENSMKELEEAE